MEKTHRIDEVPVETVVDDMCNPDGGIVYYAASDYYYCHYANKILPEQIDDIDARERRILPMLKRLCVALIVLAAVIVVCRL